MLVRFDLFFAVFAPFVVLAYAYANFHLDQDEFRTRQETLTAGTFGRIARLFADPVEIAVFRLGFENLQLLTLERIFIKAFLNVSGLIKWQQIIAYLESISDRDDDEAQGEAAESLRFYSQRHVWIAVSVLVSVLSAFSIGISTAVSTATANCALYPQCQILSFHVQWDHGDLCPCLVFIDRDVKPTTFSVWVDPPDTSIALAHVARAGYLQTVQIINRKIVELPIELLESNGLRHL